ncbi:MAG: hypothetical protein HOK67_21245 [Deltaproteobacteria bacterium]|nr:hypothetical protein [Deltaproteobacteria bacterium]
MIILTGLKFVNNRAKQHHFSSQADLSHLTLRLPTIRQTDDPGTRDISKLQVNSKLLHASMLFL